MEKDVTSFIDDATNEKIDGKTFTGKLDDVAADIDGVMKLVYNYIEAQLNLGKLGYAELKLTDADVAIRLETNLINLPLQEIKRISKMISDEDKLPVNVYILMISPLVNASGLRIDEVSSADDYIGHVADYAKTMNEWVAQHIEAVKDHLAQEAEKEKETHKKAPAKRTAKK